MICELLTTGQCNLEQRNDNGHDALMEASSAGHLEVVKMLHNAGSECQFLNMNGDFKVRVWMNFIVRRDFVKKKKSTLI